MKALKTTVIVIMFTVTAIVIALVIGRRFNGFKSGWFDLMGLNNEFDVVEGNLESFKDIEVNSDVVSFKIEQGNDFGYMYKFPENTKVDFEIDDEKLKVTVKSPVNILGDAGIGFPKDGYRMVIYVPEGTKLGDLETNFDAGDMRVSGFTFEKINIDGDAGNVIFNDIISEKLSIKTDACNVEIADSKVGDTNISSDAGNIELTNVTAKDINADTDMGNIELKNTDFEDGEFTSELGNIEVFGNFEKITAKCSLGNVEIDSDNLENAKINAKVSMGALRIGGKNIKGTEYNQ
ncbi:MAG: DUF4097 family beta strand repeat protein [Lachnospiraceae bacterium]|nr:DUF4097 family beta strand repeat protein [Lachnospiraceae bacterium]